MPDEKQDEKNGEKFDEKEMEKREEKTPEEKNWDEKWRRDPLSAIVWAGIFIWAGLVLIANNAGWLKNLQLKAIEIEGVKVSGLEAWSIILLGAGLIVLVEVVIRLLVPAFRRPVGGSIFFALILIGVGLSNMFNWDIVWPIILIALGLSILLRGMLRGKPNP